MTSFVDALDIHFANAKESRSFLELLAATTAIIAIVYGLEHR